MQYLLYQTTELYTKSGKPKSLLEKIGNALSSKSRQHTQEPIEVKEIRDQYKALRAVPYIDRDTNSIQSLLEKMRKYPLVFKEEIKVFEETLEQKRRDAFKMSW